MSFREALSWKIAFGLKPLYMYMRRHREPWGVTMQDLEQMPVGSLGHDMYRFLKRNRLDVMPRAEFHDVYHVLFEYGTDIRSETLVQFVPLGNGRVSLPYLACTCVSALFYPEFWGDFYHAFHRGRQAKRFHDWNFKSRLEVQTTALRKEIFGYETDPDRLV